MFLSSSRGSPFLLRLCPELNADSGSPWEPLHLQTLFPLEWGWSLWKPTAPLVHTFPTTGPNHVVFFSSLSPSNCRICLTRAMRTEDAGCFFMDPCIPWLLMRFTLGCFWLVYYCSTSLSPPTSSQCTRKLQQYQSSVKDNFVVSFVRFFFKRFQFFVWGGKKGGGINCKTQFFLFVLTLMHL